MLLEKAWAKVCGNYENSIQGLCSEALRLLTGAPVERIEHLDIQEVWGKIFKAYNYGYTICCLAEKETKPKVKLDDLDLFSPYAYSVVAAYEYDVEYGTARLLKIKNSGSQKWLGMFSDTSKVWKDELKEKTGVKPGDDSTILISIEDYLCYFRTTLVCMNYSEFNSKSIKGKHAFGESSLINISVKSYGTISFTVFQFNQKYVGRNESKEPSFIRFVLGKKRKGHELIYNKFPIKYIEGKTGYSEYTTITDY